MVVRKSLDNHPASVAARDLVARMEPWTERSERRYRCKLVLVGAFPAARRRLKANRAARKLGFCQNKQAMDLMYNCIHPSSLDALSAEQRSEVSSEVDPRLMDDTMIEDWISYLRILPLPLWSMGKSFRINDRQKRCIIREAKYAHFQWNEEEDPTYRFLPHHDKLALSADGGAGTGTTIKNETDKKLSKRLLRDSKSSGQDYALIAWSLPLPFLLGTQSGYWRQNKFLALSYFLGCALLDRTGTFNDELGIKLYNRHPIPTMNRNFRKSLERIMLDRAQAAIDLCRSRGNREIWLQWSGGIDTTAAVCAFLRVTDGRPDDRELLVIYYQERSIEEYPVFFRDVVSQHRHRLIKGHVRDMYNVTSDQTDRETPLIVTGDPADMLFGTFRISGAFEGYAYEGREGRQGQKYPLKDRWQDRAPRLLHERRLLLDSQDYKWSRRPNYSSQKYREAAKEWVAWMERQVAKSPIPVVDMFDWWFWVTYSCKYNHDVHRIFYNRKEIPLVLRNRVFNFYDCEDMHQYAFSRHKEKIKHPRVWASYKHTLKAFILDYCRRLNLAVPGSENLWKQKKIPDDHTVYYMTKIKVPSVAPSWGMEVGIDVNWNVVRFGACSISLLIMENEIQEKYVQRLLTVNGRLKRDADSKMIQGDYRTAVEKYLRAHTGDRGYSLSDGFLLSRTLKIPTSSVNSHGKIDCSKEISICKRACSRQHYGKSPGFVHTQASLQALQLYAVSSTLCWRDPQSAHVAVE